jgi:hypothetical protein
MAGALNRTPQLALVFCTGTCLAPWPNFAVFSDKATKQRYVFVVDFYSAIGTELTHTRP